ncbi:MAG: hypothetical protein JSS31_01760 [Proteobacteria bacterium]|nr:hypothetical protein [Pseudomonadota bacterium]MBS0492677.1 hypothetical protein [Pseudomonadota bacterium]
MATKKHSMSVNPKITLEGPEGARVEVDLSKLKATAEQKKIVSKLLSAGDLDALTIEERNKIKDLKATVGLGTPVFPALIVRFDWKWVRID